MAAGLRMIAVFTYESRAFNYTRQISFACLGYRMFSPCWPLRGRQPFYSGGSFFARFLWAGTFASGVPSRSAFTLQGRVHSSFFVCCTLRVVEDSSSPGLLCALPTRFIFSLFSRRSTDLVLIMDTARFKLPPHWAPLSMLWEAMKTLDPETGKPRGFLVLEKAHSLSHRLFTANAQNYKDWPKVSTG